MDEASPLRDPLIDSVTPTKDRANFPSMIDLYYWFTPNGHKITIFLEEAGLPYKIIPVNIGAGEQHKPEFLAISPNNKIPAIVDHQPADQGPKLPVFESGAILWYLAEKVGKFVPNNLRGKVEVSQWLFWQMGGLGPMAGQAHHFLKAAPEQIPYAINRYTQETDRLFGVLNKHLEGREWVSTEYSIADMAIYPWIRAYDSNRGKLGQFKNVKRWHDQMERRPATIKAYEVGEKVKAESQKAGHQRPA